MLEIYLNPDNNIMLIDLDSPFSAGNKGGLLTYNTKDLSLDAIKFLIKELKTRRDDDRTKVYEAYVSMVLKDKKLIENASNTLQDLLLKNNDNISAWVALAMTNILLLKSSEVKSNLKIFEKSGLNIKFYDDFERGLLIYAYSMMNVL